ncbi:MAG: ATP synthase subunit I [Candidatus Rokubacteria bacterium]|nr:ATP synthase subunit I [Candidatus Rokubacteria bacterium]
MTSGDLASRVTVSGLSTVVAMAAVAGWIGGLEGAAGVAGGGAVAILNFRWLARSVATVVARVRGEGRSGGVAFRGIWLRHVTTLGALGFLLGSGWTHPLAVIIGLSALPPVLVAQGLFAARQADGAHGSP